MIRATSYLMLGLAAVAATGAGLGYARPVGRVVVADTDHDLGAVQLGRHPLVSTVVNAGATPARIVGCGNGPLKNCCIGLRLEPARTLAAGESIPFGYDVRVSEAGPFEATIELHLEEAGGLRTILLTVRGECVIPTEASDGPPKP